MPLEDQPEWISDALAKLGRRIQDCRRAAGLSQDQLAASTGLDRRMLQRIERGTADARASSLMLIAQRVDVPVHQLVDLTDDAWQPPAAPTPRRWFRRPPRT